MASKYDRFWQERLAELRKELGQAAMGKVAGLDVAVIKKLGRRASWHGSTRVRDGEFLAGNMAHAVSLGRQLLQSGMLTAWPRTEFLLSISDGGRLTVEARALAARTARRTGGKRHKSHTTRWAPLWRTNPPDVTPSMTLRSLWAGTGGHRRVASYGAISLKVRQAMLGGWGDVPVSSDLGS